MPFVMPSEQTSFSSMYVVGVLFSLAVFHTSTRGEGIPPGIVVLNHTMLQTWYDPVQICMMEDRRHLDNASYWTYLWDCEEALSVNKTKPAHGYTTGFATLPSSAYSRKARDGCCNSDVQIRDRGFDWALEGYQDGTSQHAVAIMTLLSQRNMSIVFMGDSMNNQVFTAFIEECKREGIQGSFDAGVRGSLPWFQSPSTYGLSQKSLAYIGAVIKFDWTDRYKKSNNKTQSVYIYVIDVWYGRRAVVDERVLMETLIPIISASHPSGMVVLPNIGHHLEAERSHNNYQSMVQTVAGFLNWMHEISKLNSGRNFVAFRETTPSHFDSPNSDGSFEKWKAAGRGNYDYMASNSWDGTLYHCHSINNSAPSEPGWPQKNSLENVVVHEILSAWGGKRDAVAPEAATSVEILHVFQYLAPFYRLKYGFCGGYDRIPVLDCVHFCAWGPTMWFPIWSELSSMLSKWSLQQRDKLTDYTPIFGKTIMHETEVLECSEGPGTAAASATPTYYLSYHGVLHMAPNLHSIEEELGLLSNSSTFPKIKKVDKENLGGIPLGHPIQDYPVIRDGSALQQHGDGQIWFYKNGTRHAIPNWDTFCSLGFGRASILHISDNAIDRLPIGVSVTPRDWPTSC